jgi:hypothetical protein
MTGPAELDSDTKLYTLASEFGLTRLVAGEKGIVLSTQEWQAAKRALRAGQDVERALAKVLMLGRVPLAEAQRMEWLKHPMKGRKGLLEVRVRAVRFYGGRVGKLGERDLFVLVGAEQKRGNAADAELLDRCEAKVGEIARHWSALTADNVIALPGHRQRSKS